MMKLNLKNKTRGFTMIELIIVIAILGILAVFALPRFGQFTSNAKIASRDGVQSAVSSATGIAHAQWVANGQPSTITLEGASGPITMNSFGYPDVTVTYFDPASCQILVNNLLSNVSGLTVGYTSGRCSINHTSWPSPVLIHLNY